MIFRIIHLSDLHSKSDYPKNFEIERISKAVSTLADADEYVEPASKTKIPEQVKEKGSPETATKEPEEDADAEVVHAGTDVYKEYIGKCILHKVDGSGIVRTCDGERLEIEFDEGPKAGETKKYSIDKCISKELIQIV